LAVGALDQLGLGDATVFHCVVHERGADGLGIELPVGAQARHRQRVCDVGQAAVAHLAQVRFIGEFVGFAHQPLIGLAQVVQLAQQAVEGGGVAGFTCVECCLGGRRCAARAQAQGRWQQVSS
jgi:hypothetical protein